MFKRKNNQDFFPFSQIITANLENDLKSLLQNFCCDESKRAEIISFVIAKYSEKTRYYHNLSHINALLFSAENLKEKFEDYESIKFAIWFHDVIYEPKSSINEIESAKIAAKNLNELNLAKDKIKRVEKMILGTQKHDATGLDYDGKLFLDLDLGILGTDENIYQKYKQAIRCEYSFVPWFLYRRARSKILANFLNRESIYFTDELRENFETMARVNVANEIKELS